MKTEINRALGLYTLALVLSLGAGAGLARVAIWFSQNAYLFR